MHGIATTVLTAILLFFASFAGASDASASGWRRCEGCGPTVYVYPKWRGYGWGFAPHASRNRPFAYYPFWRGRDGAGSWR